MNVLATKHEMERSAESKGRPLGRVGIAIVLSFVGLVFATAFLGVRAATVNSNVSISAAAGQLTATGVGDYANLGEDEQVSWSWFSVATQYGISSNNTEALAQECARADSLEGGASYLDTGLGSSADLNGDSAGNLYCFEIHIVNANTGSRQSDYGGYVVSQAEAAE